MQSGEMQGVFIDETVCQRCYACVNTASETFTVHEDPFREQKAYVAMQFGDAKECIDYAVDNCPSQAIKWVTREDIPQLEYSMKKCMILMTRVPDDERDTVPGPYEILNDRIID